jgi:hypothetical protein
MKQVQVIACAVTTFPEFTPFDSLVYALGECRRVAVRGVAICLGTATAACAMAAFVTTAAAWIVAGVFSVDPHLRARAPTVLETIALGSPRRIRFALVDRASAAHFVATADAGDVTSEVEPADTAAAAYVLASVAPLVPTGAFERAEFMPLPSPALRPAQPARAQAAQTIASAAVGPAAPQAKSVDPLVTASIAPKLSPPERPRDGSIWLRDLDSRTAVYDIAARTVYMPDGTRLEAHSGLGKHRDDPQSVNKKNRGPTPPNVYDLTMRERLFHGVRAIRLNPVAGSAMYGRDGILAHTYMLGPTGQSFGCVSFKDYNKFLQAFLRGEVTRMIVAPRLGAEISLLTSVHRSSTE